MESSLTSSIKGVVIDNFKRKPNEEKQEKKLPNVDKPGTFIINNMH